MYNVNIESLLTRLLLMSKSDMWCADKKADYDVVVKNVTINPDPVVSGDEMEIKVPAYTGLRGLHSSKFAVLVCIFFGFM